MGKNKKLKRQAASAASPANNKKQKQENNAEVDVEIETLSFDDAFSAGLAFEQLESYDGALAAFQQAVKCEPTHLGALAHLADVFSAAGQLEDALKCYKQASKLVDGQKDASVWFRLGLTHAALDQYLKATKAYKKSLAMSADALEAVKSGEDGLEELGKAYGVTLAALAEAFGEVGDLNAAVKVFEEATKRFPKNANLHYNLANMHRARSGFSGNEDFDSNVVACLERAIELSPDTRDFVDDLVEYLEQHGKQPERVLPSVHAPEPVLS
ncbi:hypothetical protein BBJ29_005733 [Phytophthora kernoviae]|uniref:Tetratricopeptide repeat protein 21A/21B fifth ARM repeats domain-containing protein n=1 Tax=Phytophthora kernoviae TaxID=325452 RepID=A0A3F2RNL8_9STRA|nr:hypothetical protein BBJ29_005733 [Phytophthora kernoviae]RLN59977.1 hypothetical protein BBP00_00006223 [Phytophthora kernoviae]